MNEILVAVWMVTYNHENFIEQAIESVMKQETDFDFMLFIGEDCSTDNTRVICERLKEKYPDQITLLLNEINIGGRANACNVYKACLDSSAPYIALIEGDDYWTDSQKLQKQIDHLEANPSYSYSWTRFQTLDQNTGSLTLDFNQKYFPNDEYAIDFDFERSLRGWHIGTQTMVFRSKYFDLEALNKFKYFRDIHIVAHLLKHGNGVCLNFIGAIYRVHEDGFHSSVTAYQGYVRGYNCHKEIYLDNKNNVFLKKKYLLSFQNFINAMIQEKKLLKAFWKNLELFFIQGSLLAFLRNLKRILKKGISS
ncbi:MAG: glycosyltransferase [Flavobacteriaceae bacterium]|nr:glycosyltransferase [Flavobacteriaceae bacterium]